MTRAVATERPVAVVTGGSAGVGRATAVELARRGCDVAVLARGGTGLAAAVRDIEEQGGRALGVAVDVTDFTAVEDAAQQVEEQLGEIAVWVNNAMTTVFAPVAGTDPSDFQRAVEVTLLGQVWGTKVALARMRARDRGSIVNVGSALAFVGIPLQAAYCAAKFACRGFFESTRAELLHQRSGVTISMVHLPAVNTPQFEWCKTVFTRHPRPVAPIYEPGVAARAIADAAFSGRPEKVLGSWNKLLVLGSRLFPSFASHFAARGAWGEQLADRDVEPDRRANLYQPVDADSDHGSQGKFGQEAHGFLTPAFLSTLPKAARQALASARAALLERLSTSRLLRRSSTSNRAAARSPVGEVKLWP